MTVRKCTADEIKIALAAMNNRPGRWFGTEVRTGGSYFHGNDPLLIFDGLMVEKSYTSPSVTGYEIKVSRSDFLNDNKWHLYLKYCNVFYFVCPSGMIKKEELPENVGLLYYDPEKNEINPRAKKKASWREIEDPLRIYQFIVYSQLDPDRTPFYSDKREAAKAYLNNKIDDYELGRALGTKLAMKVKDSAMYQDHKEEYIKSHNVLGMIEKYLHSTGFYGYRYSKTAEEYAIEIIDYIKQIAGSGITEDIRHEIVNIIHSSEWLKKQLEEKNDRRKIEGKNT
ncbi:MAG: MmcB family DNA repair protein [Erysipelotrichaceae bacterium]|nr:MmcB family DNA repair protein [Erysipelotrichaceae bacterium]